MRNGVSLIRLDPELFLDVLTHRIWTIIPLIAVDCRAYAYLAGPAPAKNTIFPHSKVFRPQICPYNLFKIHIFLGFDNIVTLRN